MRHLLESGPGDLAGDMILAKELVDHIARDCLVLRYCKAFLANRSGVQWPEHQEGRKG